MKQYIDKDELVAEIKKHQAIWDGMDYDYCNGQRLAYSDILSFLDTLEVKEVDLDKEIKNWLSNGPITDTRYDDYDDRDIERTAKHFFELGMLQSKQ